MCYKSTVECLYHINYNERCLTFVFLHNKFKIVHNTYKVYIPLNSFMCFCWWRKYRMLENYLHNHLKSRTHCKCSRFKSVDSGARLSGFELWLCQTLPERPWASPWSSLGLQSYYLWMRSNGLYRINCVNSYQVIRLYLAHCQTM